MGRIFVCLIILMFSAKTWSQQLIIAGKIIDEVDKEPIALVSVQSAENQGCKTQSDRDGYFVLTCNFSKGDRIVFQHVGFQEQELYLTKKLLRRTVGDTLFVTIAMPWRTLKAFSFSPDVEPDTLFGSELISVSDYQFYDNERLIMLVYEKNLRRGSKIVLVDHDQNILDEEIVPERAEKLYRDYLGRVNVVCQMNVYMVKVFGNKIDLEYVEPEFFQRFIVPVVDTGNGMIYYSNYNPDYPAFEYYAYNPVDSSHKEIVKVEDKLMMELYCAEYKYVDGAEKVWAMRKEDETGIDKEIWIGLKYFTNSLYYKSLYAPLFVLDDELVVFDHYADMMHAYDGQGNVIDSTSIYYHKIDGKESWDNQVIHDELTNKLYAVFQNGGYHILSEIDQNTGDIMVGYKLFYKYAEQIQIRGGKIYYIYRPFESLQKKFLYVEKLRSSEQTVRTFVE